MHDVVYKISSFAPSVTLLLSLSICLRRQLRLLDQSRRRITSRHVHLDQPKLVRDVECFVRKQV